MGALVLALGAAVAYGTSDFVGGLASRRVAVLRVLVVSYPVSAVLMTLAAIPAGGSPTSQDLLWGVAAGLAMAVAAWTFYLALSVGPISVISPITALLSSVVPVAVGVALGERMTPSAVVGVTTALLAVVLVSLAPHADMRASHPFTRGVAVLTFVTGVAWALSYVFTHRIPEAAGLWPLVAARWAATLGVCLVAAPRGELSPPLGRPRLQAVLIGTLDAVAHLTMMLALQQGMLSVASVVVSLFPGVTVVLAVLVLGERLTRAQSAGMVIAAASLVLIGL